MATTRKNLHAETQGTHTHTHTHTYTHTSRVLASACWLSLARRERLSSIHRSQLPTSHEQSLKGSKPADGFDVASEGNLHALVP
eukprot:3213296-Amphidinium_carterae.1